jgi:hypothetical protein
LEESRDRLSESRAGRQDLLANGRPRRGAVAKSTTEVRAEPQVLNVVMIGRDECGRDSCETFFEQPVLHGLSRLPLRPAD